MNAKTADQIKTELDQQKEKALRAQLADNAMLAGAWWNFMQECIRSERETLSTPDVQKNRATRENFAQTAAAWERAQYLFFGLLPGVLDELRETVAAQIEREYKGLAAADVTSNLRHMERGELLKEI